MGPQTKQPSYLLKSTYVDEGSQAYLDALAAREKVQANVVPGVRTVLVVLSAGALAFDPEALRHKVLLVYPDAAVFFRNTSGSPHGVASPERVDLLIDLTGPRQRQGIFYARKLRGMARFAVGRNAGLFRKRIYDRVFDEKENAYKVPKDLLERERYVQKEVMALAGIPSVPVGSVTPNEAKTIALKLPPLRS